MMLPEPPADPQAGRRSDAQPRHRGPCPPVSLDVLEAAAYLGISQATLERLVYRGELANVLRGSAGLRFRLVDLEDFEDARRSPMQAPCHSQEEAMTSQMLKTEAMSAERSERQRKAPSVRGRCRALRGHAALLALLLAVSSDASVMGPSHRGGVESVLPAPADLRADPAFQPGLWQMAQVAPTAPTLPRYSFADGLQAGDHFADRRVSTGGGFTMGLAGGFLFALPGAIVAYALTGPEKMSAACYVSCEGKGSDYEKGFYEGFTERSKTKKRNAALWGGSAGMSLLLVVYVGVIASAGD